MSASKSTQEDREMLAVAIHGENVAPRFCSANQFLIAELGREQVRSIRRVTFSEEGWLQRLERLSAAGVSVLLCGGFNSSLLPLAENLGIRVFSDLAGRAERLVDAFLRNELERYELLPYWRRDTGDAMGGAAPPEPSTRASTTNRREGADHAELRRNRPVGDRTADRARPGPLRPTRRENDNSERPVSGLPRRVVRPTLGRRPWPWQ
jgi:predicted Fe-Mo cluster-binding NifX family protein